MDPLTIKKMMDKQSKASVRQNEEKRVLPHKLNIYEFVSVLTTRIVQIKKGSPVYVTDDGNFNEEELGIEEIVKKKCPLKVGRDINGTTETWSVNELSFDLRQLV